MKNNNDESKVAETTLKYDPFTDMLNSLKSKFQIVDYPRIKEFLLKHKYLINVILKAPSVIKKIFGDFPILLELHRDPEENWEELFIVIKTSYPAEKALQLEEVLFKEWFVLLPERIKKKLNFTEEPL